MDYIDNVIKHVIGFAIVGVLTVSIFALQYSNKPSIKDFAKATVMITGGDHGGTGVILSSSDKSSEILTNRHVCDILVEGGIVTADSGKQYPVQSYKRSNQHDMCLVKVAANLGVYTKVAESAPVPYEEVTISGHPSLYPTIITKGYYSQKYSAIINSGVQKCTEQDLRSSNALLCIMFGGLPILKKYDTQVVSATIKGGSSGSAVYNSNGELTNLAFAGAEGLSYALTVPFEYIKAFLDKESKILPEETPNNTTVFSVSSNSGDDSTTIRTPDQMLISIGCDPLFGSCSA